MLSTIRILVVSALLIISYQPTPVAYGDVSTVQVDTWDKSRVLSVLEAYSSSYGVSKDLMIAIVSCETAGTWQVDIQSRHKKAGIQEDSWGLVQIHLPSWGGKITKEQAINPYFALDFLAKQLKAGRAYLWSCYTPSLAVQFP